MAMLDDTKEASRAITPKARENMMPNGQVEKRPRYVDPDREMRIQGCI